MKATSQIERGGCGFGRRKMINFKPGMRVYHYRQMSRPGTILEIKSEKSKQWMIGGTSQTRLIAIVKHDDESISKIYTSDLRIED